MATSAATTSEPAETMRLSHVGYALCALALAAAPACQYIAGFPDAPDGAAACPPVSGCADQYDCESGNCVDRHCYDERVGCPCQDEFACPSRNCIDAMCWGGGPGNPCLSEYVCDSGVCLDGACE